ncbi:MAG: PqqD family protein [Hyphomicrobiales bacterium]
MKTQFYSLNTTSLSIEDFGEETVMVNFDTGKYYGLSGSGRVLVHSLARSCSRDDLVRQLGRHFEPGEHDLGEMVDGFLKILEGEQLLNSWEGSIDAIEPPAVKKPFLPPVLEVHSDLKELIMLDPVHDANPEHGWPIRRETV